MARAKVKGKETTLSVFVDADDARGELTRRSATGIVAFLNCMPIHWFTKRQAMVESSSLCTVLS